MRDARGLSQCEPNLAKGSMGAPRRRTTSNGRTTVNALTPGICRSSRHAQSSLGPASRRRERPECARTRRKPSASSGVFHLSLLCLCERLLLHPWSLGEPISGEPAPKFDSQSGGDNRRDLYVSTLCVAFVWAPSGVQKVGSHCACGDAPENAVPWGYAQILHRVEEVPSKRW